jgi:carbon-monoxide dehydrogenase small subunit
MHPLQEAFWEKQGLQCGYCTPGMLLRAYEILAENPDPTREQVKEGLASNLCRCTGNAFNIDSVLDAAERMRTGAEGSSPGDRQPATDKPDVPDRVPDGEEARA